MGSDDDSAKVVLHLVQNLSQRPALTMVLGLLKNAIAAALTCREVHAGQRVAESLKLSSVSNGGKEAKNMIANIEFKSWENYQWRLCILQSDGFVLFDYMGQKPEPRVVLRAEIVVNNGNTFKR